MKWEYQTVPTVSPLVDEKLSELGQQGWELVNFTVAPHGRLSRWDYVFKRPIVESD